MHTDDQPVDSRYDVVVRNMMRQWTNGMDGVRISTRLYLRDAELPKYQYKLEPNEFGIQTRVSTP